MVPAARHRRAWTLPEDVALMGMVGRLRPAAIGRRLGRSERAVLKRCQRIGISPCRNGWVTSGRAAALTGRTPQALTRAAREGRIRAHRVPGGRWWLFNVLDLPPRR